MKQSIKNKVLGLLACSFLLYVVLQGIGLFELYQLVDGLFDSLKDLVYRNMISLLLQSIFVGALLWALWREIRWCRYILYAYAVVLCAGAVSVVPHMQDLLSTTMNWFQYAYVAMIGYYIVVGIACLLYMFHPTLKIQRKMPDYDDNY